VEAAPRIFPPWEFRSFGPAVPNPFYPAVLLPGLTFLGLYVWPFLERRFTGDRAEHQLLDRPREHPFRTAIGLAAFSFLVMLHFAASNDVIAKFFLISVDEVTWIFRILVVTVPFLVFGATYAWLSALLRTRADSVLHVPAKAFIRRRALTGDAHVEQLEPPSGHALLGPEQVEEEPAEVGE